MHGLASTNGTWRIRFNRELENLYNRPDTVAETRSRGIRGGMARTCPENVKQQGTTRNPGW
jgi:hypothetical protein